MATSERYIGRMRLYNSEPLYSELLENRGVTRILQYETPEFRHPTVDEIRSLQLISHEWRMGDHFWKLAAKHYGDPQLWWVIAWFNRRPTETMVSYGDVINIPQPLERIFQMYGL